ncbi:MAG: response regulator [Vicinamibacterales bacterium]
MAPALNQRLRDGIAAAQARQFDRARALLQPVVKAAPHEALAWFWLAVASPSADAAIPCLKKVLEIDASHPQATHALAKLLIAEAGAAAMAGKRDEARALAVEAAELTPDADAAWLAIAAVSDNRAERVEALRRALTLNPQPAVRTRLRQALLYHAMMVANNDRAAARTLFHEAAALDPSDLRVWHALAKLADTPADALTSVRELVRLAPDHASGRVFLKKALAADARALEAAGQSEEACSRWREAVALDARDLDAWLALAQTTTDDDEAQRALEAAFEINPMDERVSSALGSLRDAPLDPAMFEPPADAFARLQPSDDVFARVGQTAPDPFAQFDLSSDPFEQFAPAPKAAPASPAPAPVVQAQAPVASVQPAHAPVEMATPAPSPAPRPTPEAPVLISDTTPDVALLLTPDVIGDPTPDAAPMPTPAAIAVAADSNGNGNGNGNGRRTVMVVDDSPTIRKILGLTLERAGYKVVAEPDGESAVERLAHVVPDVILLDIAMPKLDGYDVCKRIKKDPRTAHVPVVMLSGKDAFFDKVKGRMAGATEYLTKPFETPAVLSAVSTACQPAPEVVHG